MITLRRRTILSAAAGVLAAGRIGQARAQGNASVRIGISVPLSGPNAPVGQPQLLGAQVARDQINAQGGVNGRPIELVVLDNRGDGAQAVADLRELTANNVNLVLGMSLTNTAMAAVNVLPSLNAVLLSVSSPDERLTHQLFNRNIFVLVENNYTRSQAAARAVAQRFPEVTGWTGANMDVTIGHDGWAELVKAMNLNYRQIAKQDVTMYDPIYCKVGTTDFKTQISQLLQSPAQGLVTILAGSDGITFYQQMLQFGLEKKFKLFMDTAIDINLGKALKDKIPRNAWSNSYWFADAANNDASRALKAEVIKRTGELPHGFAGPAHMGINFYAAAIKQAGSTDTDKVIPALEAIRIDSVKGPAYFRKEDHQIIADTYLFSLKPKDGPPGFETNDTITIHIADVVNPPAPGTEWKF